MKVATALCRSSLLLLSCSTLLNAAPAEWSQKQAPLMTRWAPEVTPDNVLPEYPRPQMVRDQWHNLNGLWDYAITSKDSEAPSEFEAKILVPFPIESALSGVMKNVGAEQALFYRRSFEVPSAWRERRILLHFGAVDWEAVVWVNGAKAGEHRGGYDPFTIDITPHLEDGQAQELLVRVWDPTTGGSQPMGKQHARPHGIWYTPTTGIWQTPWLEPVPAQSIRSLRLTPDIDRRLLHLHVDRAGAALDLRIRATAREGDTVVSSITKPAQEEIQVQVPEPQLWSPDRPFLYDLEVELITDNGETVDRVRSYFGMRKMALGKDADGITRFFLNNKPLFQYGLLDQGFWPDGLYTAPTDAALRYDIEVTKRLGFNLARKHVKVEPARWYHWCDRLGLLVWQDMPSGDRHAGQNIKEIVRSPESAAQFERELKAMMESLRNHPSIVLWVPFNEGWGQFDTVRITELVKQLDPSRLVICASGWNDFPAGDAHDIHAYPGPASPNPESGRAAVLGEFGGLGLPLARHTWQSSDNWGYRSYTTLAALNDAYFVLLGKLRPLIGKPGLSAAIYTQTTDVEIEVNGIMTYDREIIKLDAARAIEAHRRLFLPPPDVRVILPASRTEGALWRYTVNAPEARWFEPSFDDSNWTQGPAGFGRRGTPGAVVRTEWTSSDIWLRRTFNLTDRTLAAPHLFLHHDEDAEIYINGQLAAQVQGYTSDYLIIPIHPAVHHALKPGENVIAVHCKQTSGGQYIDAGLIDIIEK